MRRVELAVSAAEDTKADMDGTGATYVSGYNLEKGRTAIVHPPELAIELILLSSIRTLAIDSTDERSKNKMLTLAAELRKSCKSCGFKLFTK